MARYVAVLVPSGGDDEWSAHLPDFQGCKASSASADLAMRQAAENAATMVRQIRAQGLSLPSPRNLEQIRADSDWAAQRRLDWSRAVVSLVEVRA
jgi:predicted RNase H-like HicB family nuclease